MIEWERKLNFFFLFLIHINLFVQTSFAQMNHQLPENRKFKDSIRKLEIVTQNRAGEIIPMTKLITQFYNTLATIA